jgi:protein-S-isoprenylcysteine O-methyltransferase Ste14
MRSLFTFAYRYRNILAGLPLVYAFVSDRWAWDDVVAAWVVAVLLCLLGILIRAWAVRHNSYAQGRNKTLAVTGPYAFVRNPLYLGNMLVIAGAAAASRMIWLVPLVVAWCLFVYHLVVRHEEVRLVARYGAEYERYRAAVPGWMPRLGATRPRATLDPRGFLAALLAQSGSLLLLIPFLIKQVGLLGSWLGR